MQSNRIFMVLILFLVWLALPNQTFSQSEYEAKTLTGFDTLNVLVEGLDSDLEESGLTTTQIQTDVEIKLRRAGFKVKSKEEYFTPYIYLYINVNSKKNRNGIFAVNVSTSLTQSVLLERDKSIQTFSNTWETENIGTVGEENVRSIRNLISDQVDRFINDYLKANASIQKQSVRPPPPPPPPPPPATTTKRDDSPFTATYVGGNKPPEVEVFNDSNRTLYLDLGQGKMTAYTILSGTSQKITLTEGNHNFKASAPRVKTLEELFQKGYVYTWRFTIVTVPR